MDDREERIRARAHQIWEEEGRPEGRHHEHWRQACEEIDGGSGQCRAGDDRPDQAGPGGGPAAGAGR